MWQQLKSISLNDQNYLLCWHEWSKIMEWNPCYCNWNIIYSALHVMDVMEWSFIFYLCQYERQHWRRKESVYYSVQQNEMEWVIHVVKDFMHFMIYIWMYMYCYINKKARWFSCVHLTNWAVRYLAFGRDLFSLWTCKLCDLFILSNVHVIWNFSKSCHLLYEI